MYEVGLNGRLYGGYFKLRALIDSSGHLKTKKTAPLVYCDAVFVSIQDRAAFCIK